MARDGTRSTTVSFDERAWAAVLKALKSGDGDDGAEGVIQRDLVLADIALCQELLAETYPYDVTTQDKLVYTLKRLGRKIGLETFMDISRETNQPNFLLAGSIIVIEFEFGGGHPVKASVQYASDESGQLSDVQADRFLLDCFGRTSNNQISCNLRGLARSVQYLADMDKLSLAQSLNPVESRVDPFWNVHALAQDLLQRSTVMTSRESMLKIGDGIPLVHDLRVGIAVVYHVSCGSPSRRDLLTSAPISGQLVWDDKKVSKYFVEVTAPPMPIIIPTAFLARPATTFLDQSNNLQTLALGAPGVVMSTELCFTLVLDPPLLVSELSLEQLRQVSTFAPDLRAVWLEEHMAQEHQPACITVPEPLTLSLPAYVLSLHTRTQAYILERLSVHSVSVLPIVRAILGQQARFNELLRGALTLSSASAAGDPVGGSGEGPLGTVMLSCQFPTIGVMVNVPGRLLGANDFSCVLSAMDSEHVEVLLNNDQESPSRRDRLSAAINLCGGLGDWIRWGIRKGLM